MWAQVDVQQRNEAKKNLISLHYVTRFLREKWLMEETFSSQKYLNALANFFTQMVCIYRKPLASHFPQKIRVFHVCQEWNFLIFHSHIDKALKSN